MKIKTMSKRTKGYLLLASIAIFALIGFGVKAAIDYKLIFWQEAGKAFGQEKAKQVDLDLGEAGNENLNKLGANAELQVAPSKSLVSTTGTVFSKYIAYDSVITGGHLFISPDDGVSEEQWNYPSGISCATSTNQYWSATSSAHTSIWDVGYSTSTNPQNFATSTVPNASVTSTATDYAWKNRLTAGEYLNCVDWGHSAGQKNATPSSTGAIGFDLMPL